jgi:(1->4)-alpha-D-glucan 1-alpha-D-glucosylmutase
MEAVAGSSHGYDVTDFSVVSAERGGEDGLRALDVKLRSMSPPMHMILDIIPNHMSSSPENRYWRDVLEKGASSAYWNFFDLRVKAGEKIELPVLPAEPEALVSAGGIFLDYDGAEVSINTPGRRYPVDSGTKAHLNAAFNTAGRGTSFGTFLNTLPSSVVHEVLNRQHYLLVNSMRGTTSVSYRRFFHLSDFVALRMEDRGVFEETHRKLFQLLQEFPSIAGVRVDHVDGLARPAQYIKTLSESVPHIWVEKILGRGEGLPAWACNGTTGYEFIDQMNQLMIDRDGLARVENHWRRRTGVHWKEFRHCATESKEEMLDHLFPGEVSRLGGAMDDAKGGPVIVKITSRLPVYRLYHGGASAREVPFVLEWQQLTGAVMAKGVEDCAHYRYTPLSALNEVGSFPAFGDENNPFIGWLQARAREWPLCLNAATTHDTKRSEDVRHRLCALADMPERWESFADQALSTLSPLGRVRPVTALFFLQTVLGAWPLSGNIDDDWRQRIWLYQQKAAREAAIDTSWFRIDDAYEAELKHFVGSALINERFFRDVRQMMESLGPAGAINSLSALTLRILSAGVPDIYQGTETWNFSLVDPDNRRPVDFNALDGMLEGFGEGLPVLAERLVRNWKSGAIKHWLTRALTRIRRDFLEMEPDNGGIVPLQVTGDRKEHLAAYLLHGKQQNLAIVVPLFPGRLLRNGGKLDIGGSDWRDTEILLPYESAPVDILSDRSLAKGVAIRPTEIFKYLPVSVLRLIERPV